MILITGATGQVGREAVNALVAAGAAVRALVRNPSATAGLHGAQVVQGSFDDDASLSRAFDGVDVMLLAGRDSPDTVSQQQRVLAHARHVNVQHIVKLSAIGASSASPTALMRDHHAIDEEIRVGQASWTLLEATPLHAKPTTRRRRRSERGTTRSSDGAGPIFHLLTPAM